MSEGYDRKLDKVLFKEAINDTGECEVLHGLKRELRGIYRLVKNKNPSTLKRCFSDFIQLGLREKP